MRELMRSEWLIKWWLIKWPIGDALLKALGSAERE